ncbi:MAG: hypothetical protein ACI30X_03160 [Muribaculaceae bacterium]
MKLSFRNLAMGAALAVSSFAFAQGTPTVTEVFNRTVTSADFDGVSMGEIRCATGVNGVVYALDKSTGKIWAITADATSVYATVDVNHGENLDHVTTAITSDDAGNLVVGYANGDFFANATIYFAIVPADGSEVIYTDPLTLPADFAINRCDVIGRILGDVLSAEGAYMYISGNGSGKNVACYYISEGVFTPEEYVSDPYITDMANMNSVVPMYNTMDEQSAVDPLYNGGVFFPWNGAGPEVLDADGNASQVGRPADLAYSAVPGGDVITYGGKTYYAINYTRTSGKRTGDFVIYDEELNVVFKTENTVTDDYISGGFLNGGAIVAHPTGEGKFQLHFWGGPSTQVVASVYEVSFVEEPAPLPVLYVRGDFNSWGTTAQMAMSEAPDEAGFYHYSVTVPAASGAFKIADDAWGVNFGAETGCVLANGVAANAWFNSSNNFNFPVEGLDYTIEFVYNPDTKVASQLTLTWTEPEPTPEFPITTVFNRTVTSADFDGVSMGEIRCATGVNGVVYALDKSTGKIWAITADATSVYATVDVNHGENLDHVTTAITSDDAGNLVVGYANGDFFANATIYFAIVPADGSEVIYTDPLTLPADFAINRCDVIGRILGDVLSAEGAYMYISGNGSGKNVACYYISEGVFTPEEYVSDPYITDMANMNSVVPMYNTMDEQSAVDPLYNGGVFFPWNGAGPEVLDADGNASQVGRPADLAYSAVPGGDVITYGGKTYYAINYTRTSGKRTGDFVIYDEELNVVFKTENTVTDDFISGGFLNGGAIVAHPVGDGKFQLHFWGGPQSQVVASVYEIDFGGSTPDPEPTTPELLFLVGAPSNWTAPEMVNAEFYASNWALAEETRGSGIYTGTFTIPNGAGMFRFYSALEGWEANSLGASASGWEDVDVAFTDGVYNGSIYAGKGNFNFTSWAGGYMDFTINLNDNTINIVAHEVYTAPTLFVRGEFDTWGEGYPMEGPSEIDAEGLYHYSATVPAFTGEFKLATADWKVSYGRGETVPAIENGVAVDTWFNGSNLVFEGCEAENITIDFALNPENSIASKLTLSWEVPVPAPARNNYAYDIALTDNGEGKYVITYKATGAGNANLLLTNVATQEVTVVELDPAVEGENTVNFDAEVLAKDNEYTFAIAIDNTEVTEPTLVYTAPAFELQTRGGMVVINDTESDAFGMAVACAGKAQGFQVFDQTLNLLGTYHAGDSHYNAGNQSSPFRGAARNGLAVFGDWSDAGSNYTVIDPLNPTELNFMLGEPAVKDAAGCWTLEGVEIAGGNSGHVFVGNGDDTLMFTLVEDNSAHANTLAKYELGASPVILEAPVLWMTNATPYLPNLNLQMAAADNGLFITQIRQNPDETGVCRLLYVDFNDDVKKTWWNDVIPTASGAVALNADKSVLAVGTQTSILFFDVAISEDNEPTLTKKDWEIALATDFAEFSFDVAGNLYVYSRGNKGVLVYALPFGTPAVTAAKAALVIKGAGSGVENISLEAADANAVYFTVGGVRVAADALTPGIYVKVVGNTATKVVVK